MVSKYLIIFFNMFSLSSEYIFVYCCLFRLTEFFYPAISNLLLRPSSDYFKDFYLLIFTEREREGEREGEKHQCVVASHVPPNWGSGLQPKHVPDWELNP